VEKESEKEVGKRLLKEVETLAWTRRMSVKGC